MSAVLHAAGCSSLSGRRSQRGHHVVQLQPSKFPVDARYIITRTCRFSTIGGAPPYTPCVRTYEQRRTASPFVRSQRSQRSSAMRRGCQAGSLLCKHGFPNCLSEFVVKCQSTLSEYCASSCDVVCFSCPAPFKNLDSVEVGGVFR